MSVEDILRHAEQCLLRAEADPSAAQRFTALGQAWCDVATARVRAREANLTPVAARTVRAALRARAGRGVF